METIEIFGKNIVFHSYFMQLSELKSKFDTIEILCKLMDGYLIEESFNSNALSFFLFNNTNMLIDFNFLFNDEGIVKKVVIHKNRVVMFEDEVTEELMEILDGVINCL